MVKCVGESGAKRFDFCLNGMSGCYLFLSIFCVCSWLCWGRREGGVHMRMIEELA